MPTPSLLIVPARFKTGKLYSQIPTSGAGDFTVTRNTEARRFDSAGLIASVASGIPRLDYYTSGGVTGCPALLVEPAATNGILNSADTRTNWTLGGSLTSGAIDVIGVSGNNITVAASGSGIAFAAGRYTRGANGVALASGSTYTISFFLKQTGTHTIAAYYAVIGGQDLSSGFNVSGSFSSGSIYNPNNATNRIRRVERFGTDVFRCSETFTMTASATLTNFHFAPVESVTSANNSAVGTTMGFAAPQIELGSVPTSFIPTTTGTGSRSADVVSVSGAVSGSIGQTEGTVYAEVDIRNLARETYLIRIDEGAAANVISLRKLDTNLIRTAITAPTTSGTLNISSAAFTAGIVKIAFAYKSGEIALSVNGATALTANGTFSFAASLNRITLGSNASASSEFNDRIRAVALYTTRLTNAELATLTTP
jgi:hypothetical protein